MTPEEALTRIESGLGTQFHPDLGRAFIAMMRGEQVAPVVVEQTVPQRRQWFRRGPQQAVGLVEAMDSRPTMANLPGDIDRVTVTPESSETRVH
jgi:hypothetical protein